MLLPSLQLWLSLHYPGRVLFAVLHGTIIEIAQCQYSITYGMY